MLSYVKNNPIKILVFVWLIVYLPSLIGVEYLMQKQLILNENAILPLLGSDSQEYKRLGENLLNYGVFSLSKEAPFAPETFRTPGYPLFLALLFYTLPFVLAGPIVQSLLVLLTSYFIWQIGVRSVGSGAGLVAGLLYMVEPSTVLHSMVYLSDSLFVVLFVTFIYLCFFKPKLTSLVLGRHLLFAGLILGLSLLVRPIAIFLPIVLLPFFWWRYYQKFSTKEIVTAYLLMLTTFSLTLMPWLWRNKTTTGVIGISSVSAYNLVYYNLPLFLAHKEGGDILDWQITLFDEAGIGVFDTGRDLRKSASLTMVAKEKLKQNLWGYTFFHAIKTAPFFIGSSVKHAFQSYDLVFSHDQAVTVGETVLLDELLAGNWHKFWQAINESNRFVLIERLVWLVITVLAFLAAVLRSRHFTTWFFIVLILYFAVLTGPVSYVRYRLPAEPFMFLLVVDSFYRLYLKVKNHNTSWLGLAVKEKRI